MLQDLTDLIGVTFAQCVGAFTVILGLAFLAVITERIVRGSEFRALRDDRDYWRDIALPALRIGHQLGEFAESEVH